MPLKPKSSPDAPLAPVPAEILDQFVRQGSFTPEELDAAVRRFKNAIIERALGGELTHHLGYPPGAAKPGDATKHRNGKRVPAQLRTIIKTRGHFPTDDAATTLIWLALRNITATWARMSHSWRPAMNQFAILDPDRFQPTST